MVSHELKKHRTDTWTESRIPNMEMKNLRPNGNSVHVESMSNINGKFQGAANKYPVPRTPLEEQKNTWGDREPYNQQLEYKAKNMAIEENLKMPLNSNSSVPNGNSSPTSSAGPTSLRRSTYSEKDGLRMQGDEDGGFGQQLQQNSNTSVRFIMTVLGCAFSLAGAQLVGLLYLTLGTRIAKDLNSPQLTIWLLSSGIIAMGAMAPFVGPISDLYGRKPIFLSGVVCSIIGAIACAATPSAGGFIAGQSLLGLGAVIEELMALSVVSEIVPTAKRGLYAAMIMIAILPWSPGTLYADFIAASSWRWIGLPLALWHVLIFAMIYCFYFPPPRVNAQGLSNRELIKRVDWFGGFILIFGSTLVLIALNWGGQQYSWTSSHVLSFIIVGFTLMIGFCFWEKFYAEYPLYPKKILRAPRPFLCIMFVIFSAGINYIPLVVFWPIEAISVYGADVKQSGIYSLPIGTCIIGGAIVSAILIGMFKPYVTTIMTVFCIMQTCGNASLAAADPHSIASVWGPLCSALIGVGGVLVPNQIIITILTPDELIASATALTVAVRCQAQVAGLALFYSRFLHVLEKRALRHYAIPVISSGIHNITVIKDLIEGLASHPYSELAAAIPQLSGPTHTVAYQAVKEGAIQTYKGAFDFVYLMSIGFGVAACIAAAAMGNIEQYIDEHTAVILN